MKTAVHDGVEILAVNIDEHIANHPLRNKSMVVCIHCYFHGKASVGPCMYGLPDGPKRAKYDCDRIVWMTKPEFAAWRLQK